jgi:hypothetical protein
MTVSVPVVLFAIKIKFQSPKLQIRSQTFRHKKSPPIYRGTSYLFSCCSGEQQRNTSCYVYLTRCMVYGYAPPEKRKVLALNHYYQVLGCFPELVRVVDDKVRYIFFVFLFCFKNIRVAGMRSDNLCIPALNRNHLSLCDVNL